MTFILALFAHFKFSANYLKLFFVEFNVFGLFLSQAIQQMFIPKWNNEFLWKTQQLTDFAN